MKTNKKHQTERTSIQELTQLFEHFNTIYNDHFFLNVINTNQPKKKKQ
jgi:hypothetical protein